MLLTGVQINKDKGTGISLHVFPKDPTLRQKWAFAIKRKEFNPSSYSQVIHAVDTSDGIDNHYLLLVHLISRSYELCMIMMVIT